MIAGFCLQPVTGWPRYDHTTENGSMRPMDRWWIDQCQQPTHIRPFQWASNNRMSRNSTYDDKYNRFNAYFPGLSGSVSGSPKIAFGDCWSSTFYRPLYRQFNGTIISFLLIRNLQSFEIWFEFESDVPIWFDSNVAGRFKNFESPCLLRLPSYH